MTGLDAAFWPALWSLSIATGTRPEVYLAVWWAESGLDPSAANKVGCTGLNQSCPTSAGGPGFPDGYGQWPASEQVTQWIGGQVKAQVSENGGPFRSAARYQQANFLPATLATARAPGDVICGKAGPYASAYAGNAQFDVDKTGTITLADLGKYLDTRIAKYGASYHTAVGTAYAQVPAGAPWAAPAVPPPFYEPASTTPAPAPAPPPSPKPAGGGAGAGAVVVLSGLGLVLSLAARGGKGRVLA